MSSVAAELLKEGGCYDWFRSQEPQDQWLDVPVTHLGRFGIVLGW